MVNGGEERMGETRDSKTSFVFLTCRFSIQTSVSQDLNDDPRIMSGVRGQTPCGIFLAKRLKINGYQLKATKMSALEVKPRRG